MRKLGCSLDVPARATLSFDSVHLLTLLTLDTLMHGADGVVRHHVAVTVSIDSSRFDEVLEHGIYTAKNKLARLVGHAVRVPSKRDVLEAKTVEWAGVKMAFPPTEPTCCPTTHLPRLVPMGAQP